MSCLICSLKNVALQNEIERRLDINAGFLTEDDKKELKSNPDFADSIDIINKLTPQECEVHWNFHQSSSYAPCSIDKSQNAIAEGSNKTSLRDDIGKDEAGVIYDLTLKQMTTFNRLTKKIESVLNDTETDLTCAFINPVVLDFYKTLTSDIRDNVKTLKDLNAAVNGEKSGSLEGLKAIAVALSTPLPNQQNQGAAIAGVEVGAKDLSTNEFDY